MAVTQNIEISCVKNGDGWAYTVAWGKGKTISGKARDEAGAARALNVIMGNLPVIPVLLEGDIPGIGEHSGEYFHPHQVREAFCQVIARAMSPSVRAAR